MTTWRKWGKEECDNRRRRLDRNGGESKAMEARRGRGRTREKRRRMRWSTKCYRKHSDNGEVTDRITEQDRKGDRDNGIQNGREGDKEKGREGNRRGQQGEEGADRTGDRCLEACERLTRKNKEFKKGETTKGRRDRRL